MRVLIIFVILICGASLFADTPISEESIYSDSINQHYKDIMKLEASKYLPSMNEFVKWDQAAEIFKTYFPKHQNNNQDFGAKVLVQALVDPNGSVLIIKIIKSSNNENNDMLALDIAKNTIFIPAIKDNLRIASWIAWPIRIDQVDTSSATNQHIPADRMAYIENLELLPHINGLSSSVLIKVEIGKNGNLVNAILLQSCGDAPSDRIALEAAYKNKYVAGVKDGKPIRSWIIYKAN